MIDLDFSKLVDNAIAQLKFLTKCHEYFVEREKQEKEREVLLIALNRYIKLWLPFLLKHQEMEDLVIPIDIAYMWHIHKLHPVPYIDFIENLTKDINLPIPDLIQSAFNLEKELSPFVMSHMEMLLRLSIFEYTGKAFKIVSTDEEAQKSNTFKLWKEMYPKDSFIYNKEKCSLKIEEPEAIGLGKLNIMGSAKGQRHFFYQVSTDFFQEKEFLDDAALDYMKFLNLAVRYDYSIVVPRYDIDLLWHTHMTASPLSYAIDTIDIMGYVVDHDDSETDKGPDSILAKGLRETSDNWLMLYGEPYEKEGTLNYRGEPPKEFYTQKWVDDFESTAIFNS